MCTECYFYDDANELRLWCAHPRFYGTVTDPTPRCAGVGFEPKPVNPGEPQERPKQ